MTHLLRWLARHHPETFSLGLELTSTLALLIAFVVMTTLTVLCGVLALAILVGGYTALRVSWATLNGLGAANTWLESGVKSCYDGLDAWLREAWLSIKQEGHDD